VRLMVPKQSMVGPHGRLRRSCPAVANDRPMSNRWLWLAGDRVLPMQDEGEPAA
jgi:hypothetical protein